LLEVAITALSKKARLCRLNHNCKFCKTWSMNGWFSKPFLRKIILYHSWKIYFYATSYSWFISKSKLHEIFLWIQW
jgi:hypothetical protein